MARVTRNFYADGFADWGSRSTSPGLIDAVGDAIGQPILLDDGDVELLIEADDMTARDLI